MSLNQFSYFHFYIVSFEVYSYGLKLMSMDNINLSLHFIDDNDLYSKPS